MGSIWSYDDQHCEYIEYTWLEYKRCIDPRTKKTHLKKILDALYRNTKNKFCEQLDFKYISDIINKINSLTNNELQYIRKYTTIEEDKKQTRTFIMVLTDIFIKIYKKKELQINIVKLMLRLIEVNCNYPEHMTTSYYSGHDNKDVEINELYRVADTALENVALALYQQNRSDCTVNRGTLLLRAYTLDMMTFSNKLIEYNKCSLLVKGGGFYYKNWCYWDVSLLVYACLNNDEKLCSRLLKLEDKPDPRSLSIACVNKLTSIVLEMIRSKKYDTTLSIYDTRPPYTKNNGDTLLILLCKEEMETEALELLNTNHETHDEKKELHDKPIEKKYPVTVVDSDGKPALYYAIQKNLKKVISVLSTPEQLDNLLENNSFKVITDLLSISCEMDNVDMINVLTRKYRFNEQYMQEMYELCSPAIQKIFPYSHTVDYLKNEIDQLKKEISLLKNKSDQTH